MSRREKVQATPSREALPGREGHAPTSGCPWRGRCLSPQLVGCKKTTFSQSVRIRAEPAARGDAAAMGYGVAMRMHIFV